MISLYKMTLEKLKSKIWYRLVKVVFISFILLIITLSLYIIYEDYHEVSMSDHNIVCELGNEGTYSAYYSGIKISFDNKVERYDRDKVNQLCEFSDDFSKLLIKENLSLGYSVVESTRVAGDNYKMVYFSMVSILIIVSLAEIGRRIFYYIVLGKFNPKKND